MFLLSQLPNDILRTQLGNGVILMVLGMAIVFVFLTILILTTKLVSKVVAKLEKNKKAEVKTAVQMPVSTAGDDGVIAVAVARAMADKLKN